MSKWAKWASISTHLKNEHTFIQTSKLFHLLIIFFLNFRSGNFFFFFANFRSPLLFLEGRRRERTIETTTKEQQQQINWTNEQQWAKQQEQHKWATMRNWTNRRISTRFFLFREFQICRLSDRGISVASSSSSREFQTVEVLISMFPARKKSEHNKNITFSVRQNRTLETQDRTVNRLASVNERWKADAKPLVANSSISVR